MDVKHYLPQEYNALTGGNFSVPTGFLEEVKKSGTLLWIRHVVVPNLTDTEAHIKGLGEFIKAIPNVEKVELLPYHILGVEKYGVMGKNYSLKDTLPMCKDKTKLLQDLILDIVSMEPRKD